MCVPIAISPSSSIFVTVGENIRRSFNICALTSSLNASDDDNVMCNKYGPCKDLIQYLTVLRILMMILSDEFQMT